MCVLSDQGENYYCHVLVQTGMIAWRNEKELFIEYPKDLPVDLNFLLDFFTSSANLFLYLEPIKINHAY